MDKTKLRAGFSIQVLVDGHLQTHDVGVLQLLQEGDLPDGGAGHALVLGLQADLLHGHDLIGLRVLSCIIYCHNISFSALALSHEDSSPLNTTPYVPSPIFSIFTKSSNLYPVVLELMIATESHCI